MRDESLLYIVRRERSSFANCVPARSHSNRILRSKPYRYFPQSTISPLWIWLLTVNAVPAKIPDVPPLKPALPAREEKRTNTAHVIYPTVFGLIIVVLVTFIIRTDIKDSRVRRRKLTATITSTDVSPNLGVPLVRIQGAESNNVSRHDTDPPPYEPRQ